MRKRYALLVPIEKQYTKKQLKYSCIAHSPAYTYKRKHEEIEPVQRSFYDAQLVARDGVAVYTLAKELDDDTLLFKRKVVQVYASVRTGEMYTLASCYFDDLHC